MHGRHDGDAEVDQAAFIAHTETTVLRDAALCDVKFAHDLDTREDRLVVLARDRRHGLLQNAVDAIFHQQRVVEGLKVDVGGSALERGEDGGVYQADDRRDVVFAGQALDGDVLVGVVFA